MEDKLAGRHCVRCGKKLAGYRGFFCGPDCRRADYREKKRLRRARARLGQQCPLCGSWQPSRKGHVRPDMDHVSPDTVEGKGEIAGRGSSGL